MQTESENSPIPYWLVVDEHLALGAQPNADGLEWLKAQGIDLIVNLNTPDARSFWPDEAKRAADLDINYVHAPLDCSKLTPQKYELLRGLLSSNRQGRTFLHCAMNVKSSGMAHIFRVRELGHDPKAALLSLEATPGHEPKWQTYWQQMGAL